MELTTEVALRPIRKLEARNPFPTLTIQQHPLKTNRELRLIGLTFASYLLLFLAYIQRVRDKHKKHIFDTVSSAGHTLPHVIILSLAQSRVPYDLLPDASSKQNEDRETSFMSAYFVV